MVGVMPIGMSRGHTSKSRLWTNDVGLTVEQLRLVVKRKPATQYSIEENLRPKLDFFAVNWRFQRLI
jgi:hypothetical protein